MHNDLSCQCSGTVCICGAPLTGHSLGGPDGDPKPKKGCCHGYSSGRLEDEDQENCLGADTTVYYVNDDTFECGEEHWLCRNCSELDYCPVHGPQVG